MKRLFAVMAIPMVAGLVFAGGRREEPSPMGPAMKAMASTPWKVEFTTLEDAQSLAAQGPTVLFFSADWCPTCQAANRDIDANGSDLGDVKVVVVDYDVEKELKSRYGVTYQHTFVRIDSAGKELDKWSGGGVAEIVDRVKPAM